MTGLRTMWGVSFIQIEKDFGKDYLVYLKNRSKSFIREGLLVIDAGALIATSKGKFLVDGIASDLFAGGSRARSPTATPSDHTDGFE